MEWAFRLESLDGLVLDRPPFVEQKNFDRAARKIGSEEEPETAHPEPENIFLALDSFDITREGRRLEGLELSEDRFLGFEVE